VITVADAPRTGIETFTGAYHPVVHDQERADQGLPSWRSTLDGQFFADSEVEVGEAQENSKRQERNRS
jgi:hypothetical protein